MARRGALPATASLSESRSRRGAALGRLLSMSVVTVKVVAPGSEEAEASEPAPIRRRVRDQKLLRRACDHDAFKLPARPAAVNRSVGGQRRDLRDAEVVVGIAGAARELEQDVPDVR